MGVVVKQSVHAMIYTIIGIVLGALINVLSMHYFDRVEFGFTQNLVKITLQISYIGLFGFNYSLLIRGQHYHDNHPARSSFLWVSVVVPLILTLLTAGIFYLFKTPFIAFYDGINQAMVSDYFWLFPLFIMLFAMFSWLEGYLQSIQMSSTQTFAREVLTRLIYIALIILFATHILNFSQFIISYVILYLIPIGYLWYKAQQTKDFHFKFDPKQFSKKEIWKLIHFSGYQSFVVLSFVLILQIDAILLGGLAKNGFEAIAVYGMATFAISILRNPLRALANASLPTMSRNYNERDIQSLQNNFQKISVSMQLASVVVAVLMLANLHNIVAFFDMIKPGYEAIAYLIPILLIGNVFDLFGGMNMEVISSTKYYRFNLLATCTMLFVIVGLNYWLIQAYGIAGAAWATTIGLSIYSLIKILFLYTKLKVQPFSIKTIYIIGLGILLYFIHLLIPYLGNFALDLCIRSTILLAISLVAIYKLKITPEIDNVLYKLLKRFRLKS